MKKRKAIAHLDKLNVFRFLDRYAKKAGLPPGTYLPQDTSRERDTRIKAWRFDGDNFVHREMTGFPDILSFVEKPGNYWVSVDSLDDHLILKGLADHFGIHPLILEDITNPGQPPKCESFEDYLFISVGVIQYKNGTMLSTPLNLLFVRNIVFSFTPEPDPLFEPLVARLAVEGSRLRRNLADYALYAMIDIAVDKCLITLNELGEASAAMEKQLLSEFDDDLIHSAHALRVAVLASERSLRPLKDTVRQLQRNGHTHISDGVAPYLNDLIDHTGEALETLGTMQGMVQSLFDLYFSQQSSRMNEIMKTLTIIGSIFIPLTFIAGIYGMNFKVIPELEMQNGYYYALGGMAAVGIGFGVWLKSKKFW